MKDIKLSKKIEKQFSNGYSRPKIGVKGLGEIVKKSALKGDSSSLAKWNFLYPMFLLAVLFLTLTYSLVNLQVVQGEQLRKRSENNQFETIYTASYRGVIMDRNGNRLAENIPSINVTLNLREYRGPTGALDLDGIKETLDLVQSLTNISPTVYNEGSEKIETLSEKVLDTIEGINDADLYYTHSVKVVSGISNEQSSIIKARQDELLGIEVDNGNKRNYIEGEAFAHILGYTGDVFAQDLEEKDYIGPTDTIGRSGIERLYDERLFGVRGRVAREVDNRGETVSGNEVELNPAVSGDSLYLTLDSNAQKKMYEILREGVKKYSATGGAGILQDVNSGEILVLASYPSYNSNDFVGGISQDSFSKLLNDPRSPLTNKAIAAEVPPGSTFKTIVAAGGLDGGKISRSTIYNSRPGYTFSNGARFQEYRDRSYGLLNVVDALTVSSNIFFCEMIREWDINSLVPYFKKFGIGEYTYIDVPGEGMGRLPSPENKIKLANSGFYWLEDVWYPEGDSCNTVIGQGITTVTPIQMSNWIAAIANGGTIYKPHVAKTFVSADGENDELEYDAVRESIVSKGTLDIVKEGMWNAVNGNRRVITPLTNAKFEVAAKTGTAEFGRVNSKGIYEHTHAWVTGFFPYEDPQYSFVVFLEDGGESNNSATLAKEFIDWWADYSKK